MHKGYTGDAPFQVVTRSPMMSADVQSTKSTILSWAWCSVEERLS